jgi:hypothetical protein
VKMIRIVLNNIGDANRACGMIRIAEFNGKTEVVIQNKQNDRSIAQNKLAFRWYQQMGDQSGNGKEYERNHCKWNLGFPILLAREEVEPEIHRMWEILQSVPYEHRVDAMELIEVTRLFKVKEFTEYLQSMERYAADMGWHLSHPDDEYHEAMGRYRF